MAKQQRRGFWKWLLAVDVDPPSGLPVRVPNPPVTTPTSPLTQPISVVSAIDFWRAGRVDRKVLRGIPAFRRAINLICGTTGGLPYWAYKDGQRLNRPWLEQPERDLGITRSVSWTHVAEDLLLDAASLLLIESTYADGFPRSARHVAYDKWSIDENTGVVTVDGEKKEPDEVRMFLSPYPALTEDALPTVMQMARLRAQSSWYSENPAAREYFVPVEGQEPEEEEIEAFLHKWQEARRAGATAFVPTGLELRQVDQLSPEQQAMIASNEFSITEVARLTGIDATWLSVNVTTRTYANIVDERRQFLDFVCSGYIQSIEQRLSLEDCTPQGTYVKASLDAFLRSNTLERYNSHAIGLQNGFLTVNEVRAYEDRTPLPEGEVLRPQPAVPTSGESPEGGSNA